MAREFFVNADFDLSLRGGWRPSTNDARVRQVAEMPMHLLLLGIGEDSIVADIAPPQDYFAYLDRLEFPQPQVSVDPEFRRHVNFTPFGWNKEAARLNQMYDWPSSHPSLDTVRRVNGRRFSAALECESSGDEFFLGEFRSIEKLEALVGDRPIGEVGWIVKSEHGNSGLGNRRLRSRNLDDVDRRTVERLLAQDECLILERWRPRQLDIAAVFEVDSIGEVWGFKLHEVVNTTDGAFIGSIFDNDSVLLEPWRPTLTQAVDFVGQRLAKAGYFGPVCLDAFVWKDGDQYRLRPIVEINARLHVSSFVDTLRRWMGADRTLYWRLFSSRKLKIPGEYGEFEAALGTDAFDPERRLGALLTSPLRFGEPAAGRPARFGALLTAESRQEVLALEGRVREAFER